MTQNRTTVADQGPVHRVVSGYEPFDLINLLALDLHAGIWRNRLSVLNLGGTMLGGHIVALGIKAAWLTAKDAVPAAAHALFVDAPDPRLPCDHLVETFRDGRRLAHRTVQISQAGRLCGQTTVTLARPALAENGVQFEHPILPPAVPAPETLPSRSELLDALPDAAGGMRRLILEGLPWLDIREVPCDHGEDGHGMFWVRVGQAADYAPIDHYCLLALITDYWFVLPVHHLPGANTAVGRNFATTSLDHALWLHRQPDCADWILFDMRASAMNGGIGTMLGRAWDRHGQPLATFAQHGLMLPGHAP